MSTRYKIPQRIYTYYLPYALYVQSTHTTIIFQLNTYSNMRGEGIESREINTVMGENMKPILRPLSDLNKPIRWDNKDIVPLYELIRMDKSFSMSFIREFGYENLRVDVFEKLLEWKFDVFQLEDKDAMVNMDILK